MTKAFQNHVRSGGGAPDMREPTIGPAPAGKGQSLGLGPDPGANRDAGLALTMGSATMGSASSRGRAPQSAEPASGDELRAERHIASELADELRSHHTPMPEHTFDAGTPATDSPTETRDLMTEPAAKDAKWEQTLPLHDQNEQAARHNERRHATQPQRVRTPSEVRERIVLLSIALVGTAMTSMLHIQLGYGIGIAMAASATFMVVAILAHQLMLRAAEVHRLRRELSRGEHASVDQSATVAGDVALPELANDDAGDGIASATKATGIDRTDEPAPKIKSGESVGSAWSLRPRTMDGVSTTDAAPISTVETDLARIERKIRELARGVDSDAAAAAPSGDIGENETPVDDAVADDTAAMETALREAFRGNSRDVRTNASGQEPVFGKRIAPRGDDEDEPTALATPAPSASGRSASQLETSINALKAAASSMRTHGLPQGRAGAGHGPDGATKAGGPATSERSLPADHRLAMPSFSDPFALSPTVERIASSKSARPTTGGEPTRDVAQAPPAPTRAASPAGSTPAATQPVAATEQRRATGTLPDITIPATAVSLRKAAAPAPAATGATTSRPATTGPSTPGSDDPFDFADVIAAALPPPNPRLAAIARALEAGRMEVTLSPIVGLESHAVSHYAIDMHLVGDDGAPLADAEKELTLGANDLLALFDEARIRRAATLAAQMVARNKPGALLSQTSGASLSSQPFADAVTEIGGESPAIALRLVLTFAQRDVLRFAAHDWQALSDMQAFGFRFALSNVETLDANFADLAASGFLFVTASARQLIDGFGRKGTRLRPAAEACQRFAAAGLTVVATDINDPADRAKVFGFGALYGQGTLFGAPRTLPVAPWQPEGAGNGGNGHGSAAA